MRPIPLAHDNPITKQQPVIRPYVGGTVNIDAYPEVTFRVGRIHARLWRKPLLKPGEESSYWVTLGRAVERAPTRATQEESLNAADIPQLMLALKKAHDYARKRSGTPGTAEFLSADALIQRIP